MIEMPLKIVLYATQYRKWIELIHDWKTIIIKDKILQGDQLFTTLILEPKHH